MDLDGDGRLDVLSGSWPGELFLFRGGPGRTFAAPIKLKNKDGKTINIGGGRRGDSGEMILIAGDATYEKTDNGTVIVYDGERIEIPEGKQAGITGTASANRIASRSSQLTSRSPSDRPAQSAVSVTSRSGCVVILLRYQANARFVRRPWEQA